MIRENNDDVGFSIVINNKVVDVYEHDFDKYIWAKKGNEYGIMIWNKTNRRVEVVISVDGINIITGETANYSQRGYVINSNTYPNLKNVIPGFRIDEKYAGNFTFGGLKNTYANILNKPDNIGVIGAAFFHEKEKFIAIKPIRPVEYYNGNPVIYRSLSCDDKIGTEFGRQSRFETKSVEFERGSDIPFKMLNIFYKSKNELKKMGIDVDKKRNMNKKPIPFPGNCCSIPKNWNPNTGMY